MQGEEGNERRQGSRHEWQGRKRKEGDDRHLSGLRHKDVPHFREQIAEFTAMNFKQKSVRLLAGGFLFLNIFQDMLLLSGRIFGLGLVPIASNPKGRESYNHNN